MSSKRNLMKCLDKFEIKGTNTVDDRWTIEMLGLKKMPLEENKEMGFGLRINGIKSPDGKIGWAFDSINRSVPIEVVAMQLKAFLRNIENDYFDGFDKYTAKIRKE